MKRFCCTLLALVTLLAALTLCACGRKKVDLSAMTGIADLKDSGAALAAQTGTYHLTALREQITGVTVTDYDDFTALLVALKSGAIDGYVAEEPTAFTECGKDSSLGYLKLVNNETGFRVPGDETGIAVAFKKGSPLLARVNAVLANVTEAQKTALMEQIFTVSMDTDREQNLTYALTSANTDTSGGTLRISMECAYAPFNWTQTTSANGAVALGNGTYANGYDVQIAKYIAAELGMQLEIVPNKWESLIPAVQSGSVDGIIAGMSPTPERMEEVDFSDCYYRSNLVIIYKK